MCEIEPNIKYYLNSFNNIIMKTKLIVNVGYLSARVQAFKTVILINLFVSLNIFRMGERSCYHYLWGSI